MKKKKTKKKKKKTNKQTNKQKQQQKKPRNNPLKWNTISFQFYSIFVLISVLFLFYFFSAKYRKRN